MGRSWLEMWKFHNGREPRGVMVAREKDGKFKSGDKMLQLNLDDCACVRAEGSGRDRVKLADN